MEILKEKILKEGRIEEGNILKVDSFLNHQLDIELLNEIGKEFKRRFKNEKITKILTIETSGIAIGAIAAQYFNVPVLFARKTESKNLDKETYESNVYSYTKEKNYKIRVA
ncbi:xanthine phosphoribosyltransferase, partial [Anaerosalibacter bizertensis]|nr:xanthine phosphoribosyltransferase [Anaerosalibacter bizertensis]